MKIIKIEQVGPDRFRCNLCSKIYKLKDFSNVERVKLPKIKTYCHTCGEFMNEFKNELEEYDSYILFKGLKPRHIKSILKTRKIKKDIDEYFKNKVYDI